MRHHQLRTWEGIAWPLLLLALFWLGGCSVVAPPTLMPPTAAPTVLPTLAPPTAPANWTVHSKQSFQITLPNSWQEIAMDDATLQKEIDAASNDNPHLADLLRSIMSSGQNKNFLFYGADRASGGVIVNNVSIAKTTVPTGTPPAQAAQDYAQALPQLLKGAKVTEIRAPQQVNGQEAGEVDYDLPLVNAAGQVVTVRGVQYIVVPNSGNAYVITVTGDAAQANQWVPLAREIAQSFWVTGG